MKLHSKLLIINIFILFTILACNRNEQVSMQNIEGTKLIDNMLSIQGVLKDKCLDTINFQKGEIIADIGASSGYIEGMLSVFHDSLTFYIQDIDTAVCNKREIDKTMAFYEEVRNTPITNKFFIVNGTDTDTNLPDSTFDKIFLMWTYPYLIEPIKFISDIRENLKDDGTFYVINPDLDYHYARLLYEKYGWNGSPIEKQISDIISCGFELITISRNHEAGEQPYFMVYRKKE